MSNAPPLVSYLIGMLAIMAGSVLFVGAWLLKPPKAPSVLPSMRDQAGTIPPNYEAKEYQSFRERLRRAAKKLKAARSTKIFGLR
jgi:hypothetical protein